MNEWSNEWVKQKLLECLARVATREEARAHEDFKQKHGREWYGDSDEDWDELDKDYVGVEETMNVIRELPVEVFIKAIYK